MKKEYYTPDIVDLAYQIIAIHKENEHLRQELDHYKQMHKMHCEAIDNSIENGKKMTALILEAALDPESVVNRGHAAKLLEDSNRD